LAVQDEGDWNAIWDDNQKNKAYQDCYKEKGFESGFYWSSSDYIDNEYEAYYVVLNYGYLGYDNKKFSYYVRCVRRGQ